MVEGVQKPIPKPRKKPPSAGFITIENNNIPSSSSVSTSDSPVSRISENIEPDITTVIEPVIGWHPSVLTKEQSFGSSNSLSSNSSFLTAQMESSGNAETLHLDILCANNGITAISNQEKIQNLYCPAPQLSPPTLPPHFTLPFGPPPPIPPRMTKDKPLPSPVPESPEKKLPLIPTLSKSEEIETFFDVSHKQSINSSICLDDDDSTSAHTGPSLSRHSSYNSSDFLQPAVSDSLPVLFTKNDSTQLKAVGESICLSGWVLLKLFKKDAKRVWATLRHGQLLFMSNDEEENVVFGPFDLSRLLFVGKSTENASDINVVLRPISQTKKVNNQNGEIIKFAPESNFSFWITLLTKCNCPNSEILHESITNMDAGGKCFIREGMMGLWCDGFILTNGNSLYYYIRNKELIKELDMRKFVHLQMEASLSDYCNHVSHSQIGPLLIMLDGSSLYIQGEKDAATKMWFNFLKSQLKRPTKYLTDCRLTVDNVPVIVDKCIKFVATYGMKQAGLYRRNGPNAEARKIFENLKNDPYATHLIPHNDETINATADVLRTFFRQLETPLMSLELQPELYSICDRYRHLNLRTEKQNLAENTVLLKQKAEDYKSILKDLPETHYNTLKKLIAHLIEVNAYEFENRASLDNLSRVFGPTVFTVDKCDEAPSTQFSRTGLQISVMHDLLENYDTIFDIPQPKKLIELFEATVNCHNKQRAEGFLIPIHLYTKDNKCFNIQSNWTAEQVVKFKANALKLNSRSNNLALFEVLKDGAMERQIADGETINSIALGRWLVWDAKDAFLLFKEEQYPFHPADTRPFAEDIKISEPGSKNFKSAQLRIENGRKIQQFPKGENLTKLQKEWTIDEIIWFNGSHERKSPTSYPHTCTFFLKDACKYNIKYAGYCVAFMNIVQRRQWLNAVTVCQRDFSSVVLIPDL